MLESKDWLLTPAQCPGFETFEKGPSIKTGHTIHHTEYMLFKVPKRYALINITTKLNEILLRAKIQDGFCYVGTMHITAGIFVNDAESGLLEDIAVWIEQLAPYGRNYLHHQTGEDNGDAHLKSYLTNPQVTIPVTNGKFDFGPWQQVFYAEFDGLRHKRILVKITGI